MAMQYLCDRCGRGIPIPEEVFRLARVSVEGKRYWNAHYDTDLCEDCFYALKTFVNTCSKRGK